MKSLVHFQARPLLVSAQLRRSLNGDILILVDSEQTREEAALACWHEIAHLIGVENEAAAEALARRLVIAVPEVLELVGISPSQTIERTPRSPA